MERQRHSWPGDDISSVMSLLQLFLYGVAIVLTATVFYEAAARTNLRRLLQFGIPIYRQKANISLELPLLDYLPILSEKLNPEGEQTPRSGWVTTVLMQTAVAPITLLLPVTENELAFRRGYEERGRIVCKPMNGELIFTGFFTWPSLFLPVILLFIGLLFPITFVAVVGYIGWLVVEQRRIYKAMGAIIAQVL